MTDKKDQTPLSDASRRIEAELSRLEGLLHELSRPVNSEKTLRRAGASLEECSDSEARLATHLVDFGQAIQAIQERQQRCMALLGERAEQLRARHAERSALVERLAGLGERTSQISEPLASLAGAGVSEVTPELLASISEVSTRLEASIADASEIATAARSSDWSDLARDADALKQQLQALKNQITLGQRKLASQAPS